MNFQPYNKMTGSEVSSNICSIDELQYSIDTIFKPLADDSVLYLMPCGGGIKMVSEEPQKGYRVIMEYRMKGAGKFISELNTELSADMRNGVYIRPQIQLMKILTDRLAAYEKNRLDTAIAAINEFMAKLSSN